MLPPDDGLSLYSPASSSRPLCSRIALSPDAGLSPTRAALSPLWSKPSLPRSPRSATTIPASLRTGPTRSLVGTGEAEFGLERLHQCAEKELHQLLSDENPSSNFNDFHTKLVGLTSVTRNYFDNLVRALENGLSDVDSHGGCSRAASSKNGGSSKASRGGGRGKGTTSTRASSSRTDVC